jgi:hypothetical protein
MFDTQRQNVLDALAHITQPTATAVEELISAAERNISDLTLALEADNEELLKLDAQIADLNKQIAELKNVPTPPAPLANLSDIHLHGDWKIGVGSDIAPLNSGLVQGTDYGFRQFQARGGSNTAIELYFNRAVTGDYSGFLVALHRRPVERNAAKLTWRGRIFHDDRATSGMQALEFDTRITKAKQNINLSSQINYAKGGMLQVVNDAITKGWQDTGIVVGKLTPNVWHDFAWEYWYDSDAKQFGYGGFTLDGTRYTIPFDFVNQTPTTIDWADGIHPQLQIGTNNKGLPFSVCFDRLGYTFA